MQICYGIITYLICFLCLRYLEIFFCTNLSLFPLAYNRPSARYYSHLADVRGLGKSVENRVVVVPQAAKNWTLKDRGKNGIWDQNDQILEELVPKKIVLVLVDEEKYPKKIVFNPQKVKKGGQNSGTDVSPDIEGVPSPGERDTFQLIIWDIVAICLFTCYTSMA